MITGELNPNAIDLFCSINMISMKKITGFALLFLLTQTVFAQNYRITMSNEIKLKKGTSDLDIIYADNKGLYLTESRKEMKIYF